MSRFFRASADPAADSSTSGALPLNEEDLGRALLLLDSGLGLFRLAHLLDAVARGPAPKSVLSIGSGLGTHEAFLALLYPDASIVGVDLRKPTFGAALQDLRFVAGDLFDPGVRSQLPEGDFVYSIECIEHIERDDDVLALMVSKLNPGGRLYLQVPFASEAELADPELCRRELEEHQHVRPGYSEKRLREMAARHGLIVESIAAAFRFPLQPFVAAGVEKIPRDFLLPRWRQVLALIETDVREGAAANRAEATAIKMLARRPGATL